MRGIVLPVVSLRALLHLPDIEANKSTRVIVMRGDAPVGFVVDGVDRLLAVAADQIEKDDAGAGTIDPALLDGVIKGAEGESPIKLLSPSRLLSGQFVRLGISATPTASQRRSRRARPPSAGASSGLAVELLSRPAGICVAA